MLKAEAVDPSDQSNSLLHPFAFKSMVVPAQTVESEKLVSRLSLALKFTVIASEIARLHELISQETLALKWNVLSEINPVFVCTKESETDTFIQFVLETAAENLFICHCVIQFPTPPITCCFRISSSASQTKVLLAEIPIVGSGLTIILIIFEYKVSHLVQAFLRKQLEFCRVGGL